LHTRTCLHPGFTPASGDEPALGTAGRPYCPMEVTGDMCGDGLGLTSWWEAAAEDGAEEMDDGEG
jgi:hypothetical protein